MSLQYFNENNPNVIGSRQKYHCQIELNLWKASYWFDMYKQHLEFPLKHNKKITPIVWHCPYFTHDKDEKNLSSNCYSQILNHWCFCSNNLKIIVTGIGMAWTLAAVVKKIRGEKFEVEPGSLGFSVTLFVVFALLAICLILLRRHKAVGK